MHCGLLTIDHGLSTNHLTVQQFFPWTIDYRPWTVDCRLDKKLLRTVFLSEIFLSLQAEFQIFEKSNR